ncbi:MAG TPA: hypothetical protein VLE20_14780 [Blastocatellia bacterium]|nr:hypothetical protein [Blastocatellia bacterium]
MTRHERISATALLTVLVALLLVGLVSGTLISHALQVLPILLASVVVVLRPDWSKFAVIPILAFWLFIMLLIWLYLLGIARVVTGHFTPAEVSLTVVIGLACVVGLGARRLAVPRTQTGGWVWRPYFCLPCFRLARCG